MTTDRVCQSDLLVRAAEGDDLAIRQLLLPHVAFLSHVISGKFPRLDQEMASVDDIVQETLSEAYGQIAKFDPAKGSFRTWLCVIAERRARNATRAAQRLKRGGGRRRLVVCPGADTSADSLLDMLSDGGHTASRSAVRREAVATVQTVIAALREDYRQAVQLRLIEGKSLDETARIMDCSPRAVQGLVDRAKIKMRTALGSLSRHQ